jgi:hypothetical protein
MQDNLGGDVYMMPRRNPSMNVDIDTLARGLEQTVNLDGSRRGKKIRPPSGKVGSKPGSRQSSSDRLKEANVESFGDKPTPKKESL